MSLFSKTRIKAYRNTWDLAFLKVSDYEDIILDEWHPIIVKHDFKNLLFADPFILDMDDDNIYLLVEACTIGIHDGHIAKLTINRKNYHIDEMKVLLRLETHLSFPAIQRIGDEVFVYPENSASGKSKYYRYNPGKETLDYEGELSDEPLTDAIITSAFGQPYLLATKVPVDNGNTLFVYKSDKLLGTYQPFQEIVMKDNTARNAGAVFEYKGGFVRPGQICNRTYGEGIVFQELAFENSVFKVNDIARKYPQKGYDAMHTFNTYSEYAVIDMRRNIHPLLHKLFDIWSKLFR